MQQLLMQALNVCATSESKPSPDLDIFGTLAAATSVGTVLQGSADCMTDSVQPLQLKHTIKYYRELGPEGSVRG